MKFSKPTKNTMMSNLLAPFRKLYEPIRKGNEYRLEKYGPPLTFAEDWANTQKKWEAKKALRPDSLPLFTSRKTAVEHADSTELFKASFYFWDEWTGSRFERVKSPYAEMSQTEWYRTDLVGRSMSRDNDGSGTALLKKPKVGAGTVCRSDPVTGRWSALDESI